MEGNENWAWQKRQTTKSGDKKEKNWRQASFDPSKRGKLRLALWGKASQH